MRTLTVEPLIPATLWLMLAVALAVMLAWYAWRRPGGVSPRRWLLIAGLMAAGAGLLLAILLNPTWVQQIPGPPGKPLMTLLVDASTSMTTVDAPRGQSRYQAAAQVAAAMAQRLGKDFEVQVRTFSETTAPLDTADLPRQIPAGEATDLAAAISESLVQDRPQGQGLVLLSDGIQTAPGGVTPVLRAVQLARAMSAAIYTETFGGQASHWDVGVALRSPQQLAYVSQKVPLTVLVTHWGLTGKRVNVHLLHEGKAIDQQEVLLQGDGPAEVRFLLSQDAPGLYRYEVRVDPVPGEITQLNNSAPLLLTVVKEPIGVLLLEGKPYWDLKFLMRTLSADPTVSLESVVRITNSRFLRRRLAPATQPADSHAAAQTGPASRAAEEARLEQWKILPEASNVLADAERLRSYQVVVLGREAEAFLTDAAVANLKQWIARDGGSLVCYRGSPAVQVNEQLARLLPVRWTPRQETRFHVKLTPDGQNLHWLWQGQADQQDGMLTQLPSLTSGAATAQPGPMAVVLATSSSSDQADQTDSPAVCYQAYGTGRVVVLEGAGMWRWAFLAPPYQQLDSVYGTLWQSLLRWLVSSVSLLPGQDMALRADRLTFSTNEPATAMLAIRESLAGGNLPRVQLQGEALSGPRLFTPAPLAEASGSFRVVFGKLPAGQYEAQLVDRDQHDPASRTIFEVRRPLTEQLDLQARPELMERMAQDTGGTVLASGSVDELIQQFRQHMARVQPPRLQRTPAWDRAWALLAVLGVWATAWGVRRSTGLV